MTEVSIRYNPYRLKTTLEINGNPIAEGSTISQAISGKRLQHWIGGLPQLLRDERASKEFTVRFHGNTLDYDDVKDAFEQARQTGIIREYQTIFEEAVGDSEVYNSIYKTYNDLMGDSEFISSLSKADRKGLEEAIARVQNNVFPIHVIATMSSGKSTLINALLREELMPSQNEACTAIITEILDDKEKDFSAVAYNHNGKAVRTIPRLTYDIMRNLNHDDDNISRVFVQGNIPFLEATETKLCMVDTPGTDSALNKHHRDITYRNITSAANNLILYILDYTQLAVTGDEILLNHVAEEIKKGGRETRDRFIFVLNKIDAKKNNDSVTHAIEVARAYLHKHGIDDPQIFPCSAFTALGLRTLLANIDPYDYAAVEAVVKETGNYDISETADLARKINGIPELHLEEYSTLTPSEQGKLRDDLAQVEENGDRKAEALIHSGIKSIESAIKAYVQKYAKAKKIADFVEPLEKQLNQMKKETEAKLDALSGGEKAEEIRRRSAAVRKMIQQGEEAKAFKSQIKAINPIPQIEQKAQSLKNQANVQLTNRFKGLVEKIEGRKEALRFINAFADDAADAISNLSAQLEVLVNVEIIETGKKLISAYQEKLEGFDKKVGSKLNFGTADLVSGALSRMKAAAFEYSPEGEMRSKQAEEVEALHQDEKEQYTVNVEKKKQVKKTVQQGVEKRKKGEERVVVGTHQEPTGETERKQVKREGFWGRIVDVFFPKIIEVPVYATYEDVEYRPVYEYVPKMVEVIEEIPTIEQETRERIHYVVPVIDLQRKLVTPIGEKLDSGVNELVKKATECVKQLKQQFSDSFEEIDKIIGAKYSELEDYANQERDIERRKEECKEFLEFVNENLKELNNAIDV